MLKGAVAKRLCTGLQIRVGRFDSGPRLHSLDLLIFWLLSIIKTTCLLCVNDLGRYTMNSIITLDPNVCHGKPCIRGLRYPVENVLEWLAGGMTVEEILSDYEDLTRDDILAVLSYAARLAHVNRFEQLAA